MKKIACTFLLALTLVPPGSFAQVGIVIHAGPPAPIVEHPGPPPEAGFIWIGGYHRWDGAHYIWVPGHYERPPHSGAHWVAHRYVHRNGGWVFVEGHWR